MEALSSRLLGLWGAEPDRTERGSDSREPPNIDCGASARIDAFVSKLFLLLRLLEEASVSTDASSLSTPFAVAVWYVAGC